jgi:hypothetical protein
MFGAPFLFVFNSLLAIVGASNAKRKYRILAMRLKSESPAAWSQRNDPKGPATYCRQGGAGVLQVSWAEYRGPRRPGELTTDDLKQMAIALGEKHGYGELIDTSRGMCPFGRFVAVVFRSADHPRTRVWFITDGRDCIQATHICDREPESSEVAEAQQIAATLGLVPAQPAKPGAKLW